MKHIYFVRHGETEANLRHIRQGPESQLTPKGIKQAQIVAKRFKKIPVDVIIASPLVRAKQTADIIHEAIQKPVEFSELFKERKNPSEIIGLPVKDLKGQEVTKLILENYHTPNWRYSDEENFEDLKKRAGRGVRFLQDRSEENILIVSHALFMRIFLARMMFGEKLSSHEFVKTVYTHWIKNTGITYYEYDKNRSGWENHGWLLKTWNDHAHLG